MNSIAVHKLLAGAAIGLAFLPATHAGTTRQGSAWWSTVEVLASDAYEGRGTGTPGYEKAARYVAEQFRDAGIEPGGTDATFFQRVLLESQTIDPSRSTLALAAEGTETPFVVGRDLVLLTRDAQPAALNAPLVFLGNAIHLPNDGQDDFAGVDIKGKVVVYLQGGPSNLSAAVKSHASSYELSRALARAGAVGYIRLQSPRSMDIPWPRLVALSTQPGMWPADPALRRYKGAFFTASANPEHADRLFARSGHNWAEILALADAGQRIAPFDLHMSIKGGVAATVTQVSAPNVIGVLPGSDPALRHQYLVMSAHLDHLGVGEPIAGDRIYNGAMDNASGIATMIEVIKAFKSSDRRPRRSILFLATCGEEKGQLGSQAFAGQPTVDRKLIIADINVDMFLPIFPLKHLLILGERESTLGDQAREVGKAMGYDTLPDPEPERNLFVRADQYSFVKAGVPSIHVAIGVPSGSPEQTLQRAWSHDRYHSPQDDLSQPVNISTADDFNRYVFRLLSHIADQDQRPLWFSNSFFSRFDRDKQATQPIGGTVPTTR